MIDEGISRELRQAFEEQRDRREAEEWDRKYRELLCSLPPPDECNDDSELLRHIQSIFVEADPEDGPDSASHDAWPYFQRLSFSSKDMTVLSLDEVKSSFTRLLNEHDVGLNPMCTGEIAWCYLENGQSFHALAVFQNSFEELGPDEDLEDWLAKMRSAGLPPTTATAKAWLGEGGFLAQIQRHYEASGLDFKDWAANVGYESMLVGRFSTFKDWAADRERAAKDLVAVLECAAEQYRKLNALHEAMQRLKDPDGLLRAREDLQRRHGEDFVTSLSKNAQDSLVKANAAILTLHNSPELAAFYYQRAIESEFNAKVLPSISARLSGLQKGDTCSTDRCAKYHYRRKDELRDSLYLNQLYHYLEGHFFPRPGAVLQRQEKDEQCLETLKALIELGGKARHGTVQRYTPGQQRDLLNRLDGDKRIIEVMVWFNSRSWKAA